MIVTICRVPRADVQVIIFEVKGFIFPNACAVVRLAVAAGDVAVDVAIGVAVAGNVAVLVVAVTVTPAFALSPP